MGLSQSDVPAELLAIGQVLAPWGTSGQIKVRILTDFPQRYEILREVYIQGKRMTVLGAPFYRGMVLLKLAGIDDRESAESLRGQLIEIDEKEAYPLPEGYYYWHQVIGLEVWTTTGLLVGRVAEILRTVSNDVYIVRHGSNEILIPAIEDVVKSIDPQRGKIVIEPIEGIL